MELFNTYRCKDGKEQSSAYSTKFMRADSLELGISFIMNSIFSRQCFLNWHLLSDFKQLDKKVRIACLKF